MGLIVTTTFTITRQADDGDPYEAATSSTLAAGAPGHLSAPSGEDIAVGGAKEIVTAVAYLPAGTGALSGDVLVDDGTGLEYRVVWSRERRGLGLDHDVAGVRGVTGGADG